MTIIQPYFLLKFSKLDTCNGNNNNYKCSCKVNRAIRAEA